MKRKDMSDDMREELVPDAGPPRNSKGRHPFQSQASLNLFMMLGCTSLMLMMYGYDFGITAWTVLDIKAKGAEELTMIYVYLDDHAEALSILVACTSIGGFLGGVAGNFMDGFMGRTTEIRLVNLFCLLGSLVEGLSGTVTWEDSFDVFTFAVGRVVFGFGLGLALRCGPMYLREAVAPHSRDIAVISIKLAMVMGMIVSYIVGGLVSVKIYGYFGATLMAALSLALLTTLPESPMFMLLFEDHFTRDRVLAALKFTSPKVTYDDVSILREEMLTETLSYTPGRGRLLPQGASGQGQETNRTSHTDSLGVSDEDQPNLDKIRMADAVRCLPPLVRAPGMHAPVLLTAGLMAFEQASGMTTLLYYSAVFLQDISVISVDWGLALLGILQLVMALVVMYTMNMFGRKPLLLYGVAGLAVSSALLTIGSFLGLSTEGRWWALIGLYAFTASYSLSLGALVWVLVAEVFPTCLRAQAISIVAMTHFFTGAVVITVLPVVEEYLGYSGMFSTFLGVAILANIFSHRYMVETRGFTLREVQRALAEKAGFAYVGDVG